MTGFERPECPPLKAFTACTVLTVISPLMVTSTSFCAAVDYTAEELYPTPPASPLEITTEFVASGAEEDAVLLSSTISSCSMSPSDSDALVLGRLFATSCSSESYSSMYSMTGFEKPECPPLQAFTACTSPIGTVLSPPIPTFTSFYASVEYAAESAYSNKLSESTSSLYNYSSCGSLMSILGSFPMPPTSLEKTEDAAITPG